MNKSNWFLEGLLLPIGDAVTGGSFIKSLRRLRKEFMLSETELRALQLTRLREVLEHARRSCRYYKNLETPYSDCAETYLRSFPILDKMILRKEKQNLLTIPENKLIKQVSSGSSGIQSVVFWTKEEQSIHRATQILWWEWAGYSFGQPILQTGITPKRGIVKGIKDKVLSTKYLSAFAHTYSEWKEGLNWANSNENTFLAGYASSLYELSRFAQENSIETNFLGAICWGDKLFDHYRKSINETFDVAIKETYASAEGLMIAAQKDLPFMYIMTPNVYIEILDEDGNEVPDGEMGHVIVTSLVAKGMPLIRYKIGDLAIKLPKKKYPEHRELNLPLLEKVIGRDTDIVRTPSGKSMVVHSFTGIFEHFPEIEQFCVIQENINSITIEYIQRSGFTAEILKEITYKIQYYLNEPEFQIHYKEVNSIAPTPSGKPQIIISKIK